MLTHISPKCDFIFSFLAFLAFWNSWKKFAKKEGFLIPGSPFYLEWVLAPSRSPNTNKVTIFCAQFIHEIH
jgi:hypothetical protein